MIDWDSVDWKDLTPRLIAYASFELRKVKMEIGPNGQFAKEYVEHAVVKVVSGQYAPTLARSAFAAISVVIHEDISRAANTRHRRM